jgi:hypothetical protein
VAHVTLVKNIMVSHELREARIMTKGTYPCSFVTQIVKHVMMTKETYPCSFVTQIVKHVMMTKGTYPCSFVTQIVKHVMVVT